MADAHHDQLDPIIDRIREARNFDFRSYKRATLRRRIERRMAERRCRSVRQYLALLARAPDELDALISSMLIKVTSFFRDPDAWQALAKKALPELLARKPERSEIRMWSVGCASGEEAYSLAILLSELLGPAVSKYQIKIFGTDVDEAAIAQARRGVYSRAQVEALSRERMARFFTPVADGWAVHKDLRRMVVFGVNNVVGDAPISRLDLIACRNVFIYLESQLQKRILSRFHYGLRPGGLLFLGKSELIPFAAKLFEPVDLSRRIYRRSAVQAGMAASDEAARTFEEQDVAGAIRESREALNALGQYHANVLTGVTVPLVATTLDGTVAVCNPAAAELWGRAAEDVVGRKVTSLGGGGIPGELLVELSVAVRSGRVARRSAEVPLRGSDESTRRVQVEVSAVRDAAGEPSGFVYTIQDVTRLRAVEEEIARARQDRQKAIEDVQATNEELQSSNEELETTNEELQSANEELQTTNEELQSTNEELETTNEELQSTNAELDATNRELAQRTEELNVLGFYQRTIIRSLSAAIVVLDPAGRISLWNLAAERLLGLTEAEAVGQLLWTLRIPIVTREMAKKIRRTVQKKVPWRADNVTYERGAGGLGHVALSAVPLVDDQKILGAVVILEDTTRAVVLAEERLRERTGAARAARRGRAGS